MAKIITEQEEMDHNGEALPILSASAKRMKIDKLLNAPLPTYDSSVPGSFLWTKIAFWITKLRSGFNVPTWRRASRFPSILLTVLYVCVLYVFDVVTFFD